MSRFIFALAAALILGAALATRALASPNTPPAARKEPPCGQVLGTAQGGLYVGLRRLDNTTVSVQAFRAKSPSSDVFADGWFYVDQCYSVAQADAKALEWARLYVSTGSTVVVGSVENGPMNVPATKAGRATPTPNRPSGPTPSSRLPHG